MKLSKCSRETFVNSITGRKEDGFSKTFISKADMQELWENCIGAYNEEGELMGAITYTVSKRSPRIVNLQLLQTFFDYRGKGVGETLCKEVFKISKENSYDYLRVSSEIEAIPFYEKIGFKMLGKQKSGSNLSMFRLDGESIRSCSFDIEDEHIRKAVFKKGKGGCVEVFVKTQLHLVNVTGSNGTGKSTRTNILVNWMCRKYDSEEFIYNNEKIGLIFPSIGYLIIGDKTGHDGWCSLDLAKFKTWEDKLNFYKYISDNHPEISTIFQEGYFNNGSMQGSPSNLRNFGITRSSIYFFFYDNVEEFLKRTNERSGKASRGLDWAENCAGWKDNCVMPKIMEKYKEEMLENDIVKRVSIHANRNYFLTELFNIEDVDYTKYTSSAENEIMNLF